MSNEEKYCVVWDRPKARVRAYRRKMDAVYDHIRFRRKQKVWFLEDMTKAAIKERCHGCRVIYVGEKNDG